MSNLIDKNVKENVLAGALSSVLRPESHLFFEIAGFYSYQESSGLVRNLRFEGLNIIKGLE